MVVMLIMSRSSVADHHGGGFDPGQGGGSGFHHGGGSGHQSYPHVHPKYHYGYGVKDSYKVSWRLKRPLTINDNPDSYRVWILVTTRLVTGILLKVATTCSYLMGVFKLSHTLQMVTQDSWLR